VDCNPCKVPQFPSIKSRILYVLSRTDKGFPPSIAPDIMAGLQRAGVSAHFVEVDSEIGHMAFAYETEKWAPELKHLITESMVAN
jgi:homoserine O-acetyltransferase/O-succinyltransferase